jgi:anthranilate phosphoribosyltransferase
VGDPAAAPRIAEVARLLGTERTLIVHGDGIDELPLDGSGVLFEVTPGGIERRRVVADRLGLSAAPTSALAGGDPAENARRIETIFGGERGPARDVVLLNAGAGFLAAGWAGDLGEGVAMAAKTIDGGSAADLLARLRAAALASVVGS